MGDVELDEGPLNIIYKSAVGHAPASHCTEPSWLYP